MAAKASFTYGDHVCALHRSPEEQLIIATYFVMQGLRAGEQCVYAASKDDLDRFRERLRIEGIDVPEAERRRALLLLTTEEAHLRDGRFDAERMLRMLSQALEDALDAGFAGLRTCGDMTWLLDAAPGSEQIVEYEALVTELFRNVRAIGMCQYDRKRLPAEVIDHALATHGTVIIDGAQARNPFVRPLRVARWRAAHPEDVPWKLTELRRRAAQGS